ncbi:MAG: putative phosphohydrolase [Candidatus Tokpelaia sp. JSC161]|jgi:3',5'-cyclic AMP phosphodiesterase CpdA|nr:MAG: putative phosphohydrolase [Candidatus Tokpelaia sp. JSC161]
MFRLIHISDLHLAPLPRFSLIDLMGKSLIGYMNWHFHRKYKMEEGTLCLLLNDIYKRDPSHLAISGDIVNLSSYSEFVQAWKKIRELGDTRDVSLVFGNHDVYVCGALRKACRIFSPWITDNEVTKNFFPYMRVRGEVVIIGISSAMVTPPFFSFGYFSVRQEKKMEVLLKKAEALGLFRIVMIHHPPLYGLEWHKRLWGIKRFQRVVGENGAELILHGHTHLPTLFFMAGKNARVPVVGVSSASQSFGKERPPAGYNLFEITRKGGKNWECSLTRYSILDKNGNIGVIEHEKL